MGRPKKNSDDIPEIPRRTPPRSPDEWENRMINLTMQRVEQRIMDGTASAAEYVHFLKLGSSRERLEQEDRRRDIQLKSAKTEALESSKRIEALYSDAVNAMRKYSGQANRDE